MKSLFAVLLLSVLTAAPFARAEALGMTGAPAERMWTALQANGLHSFTAAGRTYLNTHDVVCKVGFEHISDCKGWNVNGSGADADALVASLQEFSILGMPGDDGVTQYKTMSISCMISRPTMESDMLTGCSVSY